MFDRSVRATHLEQTRRLPGDDLIPAPIGSLTNAVTIQCPRLEVWPWLVQMGAGTRAGWYSYDRLDNGGRPSADRIVPEFQRMAPDTLFPALPGATDGFHLLQCVPAESLVIGWKSAASAAPIMTWAFVLEDLGGSTRLVVRARGGSSYAFHGLPGWMSIPIVRAVHFVMERKQLIGIAQRAESRWQSAHDGETTEAA